MPCCVGEKLKAMNIAEGHKTAVVLASEAALQERTNQALGDLRAAIATAEGLSRVAAALNDAGAADAAALRVAEQYVSAFKNVARDANTILLPTNTGDISRMVSEAVTVFQNLKTSMPAEDTPKRLHSSGSNKSSSDKK